MSEQFVIRTTTSGDDDVHEPSDGYKIELINAEGDCEISLDFNDGEPEDNNLCRNFNDVYSILNMIGMVIDHIDIGGTIEFEHIEEGN